MTKVITVTTGASGPASLVLNLNGTKFSNTTASSQPLRLAVGTAPTLPSNEILFRAVQPIGNESDFLDNTEFVLRKQQQSSRYLLKVQAWFQSAGMYQISVPTVDPATDWQVERTPATLNLLGPNTGMITLVFTPKASGGQVIAADGQFGFTLTSADGRISMPFSAKLRVVDVLPSAP